MAIRVAAVVIGLVVLGWIGRTAAAGPSTGGTTYAERDASTPPIPALPTLVPLDAGALPLAPPSMVNAPASPGTSRGRASPSDPVYLNHASVDELRRLPGVGAKRAEAILVLRQRVGRFQRVEDLLRVKGIGRGAVKKWRPLVRLDAPSASAAPDGGSS